MPVYAYECQKCGHAFEVEQGVNDPPKQRCPECRGKVNKVFSAVGVLFKGSGFYCTDSKKKSGGNGGGCGSCDSGSSCSIADSKK
ncbi:MAG TPA: zinc ribbon domain-containing protein [bacterium]|nr:MAG: Zinc ribbon domain protein [bacterium ADurb.Bin236]HOC91474.1 zinc ribbon domain-containing protein [bacterium]HOY63456.1 zinc ribbon domain-containing protein [bacterium]HPI76616.1 zinc ribbon domain-containing protein [bacterium]HPN95817.1 zinc ribbon domain-containing protein [bacterium]